MRPRAAGDALVGEFDYAKLRAGVKCTLGAIYCETFRPFESLEQYTAALPNYELREDTARSAQILAYMSECYANQGLRDKALATTLRAVSVGGETPDTLALLGAALHGSKRFDEALGVFRKVLVLVTRERGWCSRQVADSHYRAGKCILSLGKYDEASNHLTQLVTLWRNCG